MKKAITRVVSLLLVCMLAFSMYVMTNAADKTIPGDVNNDGELTIFDVLFIVKSIVNGIELDNSDVNGDGKTNLLDVINAVRIIATGEVPDVGDTDKTTTDVVVENGTVKEAVSINGEKVSAAVPEGVAVNDGTTSLTLSVTAMDSTGGNITAGENDDVASYDVHIEGVSAENTVAIVVDLGAILPIGQNIGTIALYHVENGETVEMTRVMTLDELDAHNEFYYYPATGNVYVALATFSEILLSNDTVNAWNGNFDYSWYDEAIKSNPNETSFTIANADQLAAFGAIVGGMANGRDQDSFKGKTVKLLSDINIGDNEENNRSNIIFYPIGYNSSDGLYEKTGEAVTTGYYAFMGTFDGNGNTISNIYQNTWEMKGDHDWYDATLQYSRDGMGLFGKVYGGTVKNLTVDNFKSDGEIATTGVIAAYADCGATFENIAIVNCNPRVYNIGNGGIVGCAGWYARDSVTTPITFRNITVDQTNKISALWGSWGVSCGGILGQYYPVSGQTSAGNPANAGVHFENCHVAAIIDVNNDVCSNYQYYLYRYAGMLMGTIRQNTTDAKGNTVADTTGITAEGCTYTMGDWNEYWYCEIVKNSLASYTHDHQFSRLDKISSLSEIQDANGNWIKEGNFVILYEDNTKAVCYHIFKNSNGELYQHFHDVADESNPNIYEDFDLNGDGELNDLKEDRQRYYIPFNQLFTGLDMGVTPHFEFDGVKFVENGIVKSETKFTGLDVTTYTPNESITIGELFAAVADKNISNSSVIVTVSPKTEDDTVSATYSLNTSDWKESTLTFAENSTGTAKVVITDYFYCTPTVIYLELATAVNKFTALNPTFTHTVEGGTIEKTLGEVFAAIEGVTIDSANVTVTVTNGCTCVKNDGDWKLSKLTFTGTDPVTITITDGKLCNTATATVTITEPVPVEKFEGKSVENKLKIGQDSLTLTLGELFDAVEGADIDSAKVTVTITPDATVSADTSDWEKTTITFVEGTYTVTVTDNNYCIEETATVTVAAPDSVQKFDKKFTNPNFMYRVGNQNAVLLSSLFESVYGSNQIGNVSVKVESVGGTSATGTYTSAATWTSGTIKFVNTGIVKVTITDDMYCIPTELYLEVVDATNTTGATSATSGNVVLLNDIGSGFTVSGRYTFYGNGFTLNYTGNGQYLNNGLKQGIVTVSENGTLDNLRIKATVYPSAYLYYGYTMLGDYVQGGPSTVDGDKTRYHYQLSAVAASGNATISNCYIYGGRNNIFVNTGDVTIKDTILECGVVANVQIQSNASHTVTFEDVTTIQYQNNPTIGDTSKVMLGAGILVGPETTENPAIVLNGEFKQYNWVNSDDANAVSDTKVTKAIIEGALAATDYNHTVNGKTASNLGIIYMNEYAANVTNNTDLPYELGTVTMTMAGNSVNGKVCSVQHATADQIYSDYANADKFTVNGLYKPQFKYSDNLGGQLVPEGGDEHCYREGDTINVMFPSGDAKELDLAAMVDIAKYTGQNLSLVITCKDENGDTVTVTDGKISLSDFAEYTVTYTVTDTLFFDKEGKEVNGSEEYSWDVTVSVSLKDSSVPDAYFDFVAENQKMGYYVKSSFLSTSVYQYIPFLAGLKIYDYNGQEEYLRFDGDTDFGKVAKIDVTNNYSGNDAFIRVTLTDGGVIELQLLARADSGGGSTYTGSIKTSNNIIYFVNDGTTSDKASTTTAAYWYVDYYKFTGNNGVEIKSKQQTFNSTGSSVSTPSGSFSTTIKYTVTYDANEGICGQAVGYATSASATVTLPTPTRSGYILAGWYTAANGGTRVGGAGDSYKPNGDTTLYAQWGKPCTVTYNANGGSCGTTSEKYTGTALTLPTATRDGYWFSGWYDAASGGNKIGDGGTGYTPTGDITLYAHWQEKIEYTVIYSANGGTCGTASATYQGTALTLPTPTRTGYKFLGWYNAASGGTKAGDAGASYTPTANITLYAQWTGYVVTYNANGGICNTASATYQGTALTLPTPTNDGYTFNGWYTAASGGTKVGDAGASYTPTADITLYAQWTAESSGGGGFPCVTPDTLVMLADGTQKRIDEVTFTDEFLVWDFYNGEYTTSPAIIISNHGYRNYTVVTLNFANGTSVNTINGHGFFDSDINKFVLLDENNVADYVGHAFFVQSDNGFSETILDSYSVKEEYVESCSILTAQHYNCILEGILTLTPGEVEGSPEYLMPFAVNDDMKYDADAMAEDIETYGLYVYEDFADVITPEQFAALNLQYFKVAVGKGAITYDEIIYLLNLHMN